MYERSEIKKTVLKTLEKWNYAAKKASPYEIARKIGVSESAVAKVLRYLRDEGLVKRSENGSWHL